MIRFFILLLAAGMISNAAAQVSVGTTTLSKIKMTHTSAVGRGSFPVYNSISIPAEKPDHDLVEARRASVANSPASPQSAPSGGLSIPTPRLNSVRNQQVSVGFEGLTTVDTANTNGFVVTPPDQGLCAGHGYVLEIINLVLAVYDTSGGRLTVPESANAFFGADPSTSFLTDPRCYYDRATQRWFISITNVIDSATGRSNLFLAVSKTSDPGGDYFIYFIDTTEDGHNGTPANPGCTTASPCYGDQPLLGADANGIYLTTNEFGVISNVFNGAQIYAISKAALEAGTASSLVHIGNLPLAEGIAYSVQPASSPDPGDKQDSGVEYFLSALDFFGTLDNRIAVWALTNTESLDLQKPDVSLLNTVIRSEVYGQPPSVKQKAGPYPLGMALGEPEELVDAGNDRMQNTVFASGHLWAGLNTIVSDGTNTNVGIAYFDVKPNLNHKGLSAKVQGQNYVAISGNSVIYPGIGVTEHGTVAAAFTVVGPSAFPSAAYAHLNPAHAIGVNIVAPGAGPQDDFSGYPQFQGEGVARWGDYSWGVADGESLWLATEYIPGGIDPTMFFTNFGTFVFKADLK
jgi:hypothetical protein